MGVSLHPGREREGGLTVELFITRGLLMLMCCAVRVETQEMGKTVFQGCVEAAGYLLV